MDEALDKILVPGRPHHPRVDGPVVEINFVGVPSTKFLLDGLVPSTKFLLDGTVPSTKFLSPPPYGGWGGLNSPPHPEISIDSPAAIHSADLIS